jgi:kynurenine aminotransferase
MWDRTVTVGSAGSKKAIPILCTIPTDLLWLEAFAATGWRIGWLIAPPSIIQPTLAASTRIIFCTNSPLQEAAACGLEQAKERHFFEIQRSEYDARRAVLSQTFDALGLKYTLPEGSYFILLVSV